MNTIALVGMPNVGKTALFNALTGSFLRVANFAGVTVEAKFGKIKNKENITLVDLPGLYSMDVATMDEKISRDIILGLGEIHLHQFIVVLDATNLEKSLFLAIQLKELGYKPIYAVNLMDEANRRGMSLDIKSLSLLLDSPVVAVSAKTGLGLEELIKLIPAEFKYLLPEQKIPHQFKKPESVINLNNQIQDIILKSVLVPIQKDTLTEKIDNFVLHPIWGVLILNVVLIIIFQSLFTWSAPMMDMIESLFSYVGDLVAANVSSPILVSLIKDGLIGGVGGVVVFLPQILLLFLFIQVLEDVGYLARAAFLLDGLMRKIGLPGKAVIPLLSSHACAIPGIMSTRILENPRERLVSMLVIPLTTCSARLPVYVLLIGAMIPATQIFGFITYQGLTLFALYFVAIFFAILIAALMKKLLPKSQASMLLMELPPYRIPKLSTLMRSLYQKAKIFLVNAGQVILLLSLVIWFLVSFPRTSNNEAVDIENSYAARIGKAMDPIMSPLGFDWKLSTALIPSFGAREVAVSALSTVYSIDENDEEMGISKLSEQLGKDYSFATLMSLIVWFIFAPQCISTIAIFKRESGGWKWTIFMVSYTLALAYLASFLVYQLLK